MSTPARSTSHTASVNGQRLTVAPGETLLAAALRGGIPFPNSCRVGGCATCKCRLLEGTVHEATETAYLFSDAEVEQRFILACQSTPTSDVAIEVDLSGAPRTARIAGRITRRELLTHDIARLTIALERPLDYRPGQFGMLALDGLDDAARSYSFATADAADGQCAFIVRRVEGGKLSPLLVQGDAEGRALTVEGPYGDFWLRPGDAPLLFAAGGSGLAPILAMLQAAAEAGDRRPVTLLFGARAQRDLYALEELRSIAARWQGDFRIVPVLSSEPEGSDWSGARGLLAAHLPAPLSTRTEAYLCGPPAMVDSLVQTLRQASLTADQIRFDRFTTAADTALPAAAKPPLAVTVLHYLKFFLFHLIGAIALFALLKGGAALTVGLIVVSAVYILGDAVAGDDTSVPEYTLPGILTFQLWLALPLLALFTFASVWTVSTGDPLGFGAFLSPLLGFDLIAAREATAPIHHISGFILTGLIIGMVGTITAHELTHRTWDRISMFVGRWLLAFTFDTIFSIEHVYGHHRYVSTLDDPATAPRGRDVYTHVVVSTWRGNVSAWHIESARLRRMGSTVWSWRNAFLRGHAMSLLLLAGAFAMGGPLAAVYFTACALWGKALLEIVNYMEHYGMVRDPATPVHPRHSWNTNRRISSWSMFNLTRHSHHHAEGEVPFQKLRPIPNAPMMIGGYLTTIVVALVPPLWHAIMTPKVLAWDRDFASPRERELAAAANARSRRFAAAARA